LFIKSKLVYAFLKIFLVISDKYGLFHVDSLSYADGQLNCYVTQDQYSGIIMKINQRMKKFKSSMNLSCLIGIVIIILIAIIFVILHITLGSDEHPYQFLIVGLIFM
jgi:hypothetical protein